MKEELRVIPKKNYIILGVVIVVTLLILYYFYMWFSAYNETKLNRAILDKYMNVINYNELSDYIVENPDSIIYVSVLQDEEIRKFEKRFKSSLKNRKFDKEILYMDITEDIKNDKVRLGMKGEYSVKYADMTDIPNIMVFEDGKLKSIYDIEDNGYDIDKMIEYVNNIKFSDGNSIND